METPLKILFLTRRDADATRDGDIMSLHQTIEQLERLNVQCVVANELTDIEPFDFVHLYNLDLTAYALRYLIHARRNHKRVVVTPVYWRKRYWDEMQERNAPTRPHFEAATMKVNHPSRRALVHWLDEQAEQASARLILHASEMIFPKSKMESELLAREFGIAIENMRVAHNGSNEQFAHGDAARFIKKYNVRDFVLCVARMDYQKNIPNLLRAWRDETIPLLLIGQKQNAAYFEQCRAEAGANVLFLDPMPPSDLADAYAAARVHVLASWWEQVGRSAMEAGMAGCNLVMTENSPAREYFGDECFLCDPNDVHSIHHAVRAAYDAPRQNHFAERLRANFTWEKTARVYFGAYNTLRAQAAPPPLETYAAQLQNIVALRTEAWQLRELHYNALEMRARELNNWIQEMETARTSRKNPLHAARAWLERVF